jgi:hypothetical protein
MPSFYRQYRVRFSTNNNLSEPVAANVLTAESDAQPGRSDGESAGDSAGSSPPGAEQNWSPDELSQLISHYKQQLLAYAECSAGIGQPLEVQLSAQVDAVCNVVRLDPNRLRPKGTGERNHFFGNQFWIEVCVDLFSRPDHVR